MERVLTVGGNAATRPITDFLIGNIGTEFYVCSVTGDDGRSGRSKETCLATIEAAIAKCTASKNDVIYLLPGHAETIASAGAISLDKIGIRVIGVGKGALRPILTFSATDSTLTMTAASTSIENVILIPSIDSVVSAIVVSAANCKIDVEARDATALIEFVTAVLTTAGADNLEIDMKYVGFINGDACLAPIQLVGVDTARINVDFYGLVGTAVVNFITTNCYNIDITGSFYVQGFSFSRNVVDTIGSSTWSARGWDGNSNAGFSGGDNAALATDDASAVAAAVAVIDGLHDVPTANAVTNLYMRDVVGIKTDTAVGTVAADKSLMAYTKGILEDTTVIGALGAGLSGLGGMSAGMKAEVNTEVDSALNTAVPDTPTANSLNDILSELDGANTFDNTTDSLEAIRNRIDTLNAADQVDLDAILLDTGTTIPGTITTLQASATDLQNVAWAQMAYLMGSIEGSAQGMPVAFWWVDGNITASGDGTSPATAFKTIQEAIAACDNAVDDWVFVFDLSGSGATTITMDKSFVHLIGNSTNGAMAYPRIFPSTAVAGITFAATGDRVEIANLTIGGGDQTVPAISFPVATAAGAYGVNIHDCVIGRDATAPCLEGILIATGGAAPYLVVKNNRFLGSGGAGVAAAGSAIRITGNATQCQILDNYISDVGDTATPAIWLDGSVTQPRIEGNRIKVYADAGTGSAITLGAGVDSGWICDNHANEGKDAPTANPFVDAASTNGWGVNYSGITATYPA